jgi:hypothetical protein
MALMCREAVYLLLNFVLPEPHVLDGLFPAGEGITTVEVSTPDLTSESTADTYPAAIPPDLTAPVSPSDHSGRIVENDWQKAGVLILVIHDLGIVVRNIGNLFGVKVND